MSDDIFQVKPGLYGINVDLRKLWRRVFASLPQGPAAVAARFVQVFAEHGVAESQIPQLVPGISLEHLVSPEALLPALTNGVIETTSELFGIRREWLRCVDDVIYETRWSYKSPELLFEEFSELAEPAPIAPVRAIATTKKLDSRGSEGQRIELVLVENAATLGEFVVERYTPLSDGRDWAVTDHRLELKAIVRAYGAPVPLYECSANEIDDLYELRVIPRKLMKGPLLTNPSLEDFCMSSAESVQARETEELEDVIVRVEALKSAVAADYGPHVAKYLRA